MLALMVSKFKASSIVLLIRFEARSAVPVVTFRLSLIPTIHFSSTLVWPPSAKAAAGLLL